MPVRDFQYWGPLFLRRPVLTSDSSTAGRRMPRRRVLFPEPLIPLIAVRRWRGKLTSTPSRLLRLAPLSSSQSVTSLMERREPRCGWIGGSRRNLPVRERGFAMTSSMVPKAMISPPCVPALGPRSMIFPARRMVSSSCSTTRSEFPWAASSSRASSSRALSRGWSPMVGSSST